MGCGGSKNEQDQKVEKDLGKAKSVERNIKKLLLLGAGGSGKSTLFKQLQSLYINQKQTAEDEPPPDDPSGGFSQRDRKTFKSQIYEQIIESMKILITKCEEWTEEVEQCQDDNGMTIDDCEIPEQIKPILAQNPNLYKIPEDVMPSVDFVMSTRNNVELTDKLAQHVETLWKTPAIRAMFDKRNVVCVPDSTEWFLTENWHNVKDPEYLPEAKDLFFVRYRTTGMAEKEFEIDGTQFKICDVGGQRNERRKWIHFFDNVTAVIFVAALSAYDEVPFEDEEANSMIESLEIFEEQCNSQVFENTAFILFLNKADVFDKKARNISIKTCFGENYKGTRQYDGPEPGDPNTSEDDIVEAQYEFIKNEFESKNKNPDERQIYIHKTTAVDPMNIKRVFNDVQHIVINWSLQRSGLL